MLQQDEPDDYVIATGETHTVREFVEKAFEHVGLDWEEYVEIDPKYFRPTEVDLLIGDASKAKAQARLGAEGQLRGARQADGRRRHGRPRASAAPARSDARDDRGAAARADDLDRHARLQRDRDDASRRWPRSRRRTTRDRARRGRRRFDRRHRRDPARARGRAGRAEATCPSPTTGSRTRSTRAWRWRPATSSPGSTPTTSTSPGALAAVVRAMSGPGASGLSAAAGSSARTAGDAQGRDRLQGLPAAALFAGPVPDQQLRLFAGDVRAPRRA